MSVTIACPWCDEQVALAVELETTFSCTMCGIVVDVAPDEVTQLAEAA